jgi:hypothetical protein
MTGIYILLSSQLGRITQADEKENMKRRNVQHVL